jgi:hypothetical protein
VFGLTPDSRLATRDSRLPMSSPIEVADVAPWVERLARVGYTAKAVLYMTVGLVAAQAALGPGEHTVDTDGALRLVHSLTFGHLMLLVTAAGLMGYALWRVVEAVMDPDRRGNGAKGLALRLGSAARGVFHGSLAIAALRIAYGERSVATQDGAREWTAVAFDVPGGTLLVWLAAGWITGYGVYQLYRAYAPKLGRQLDLSPLSRGAYRWVVGVSRFGIAARGVVFCLIGLFLGRAAALHDAGQAGGVQESLGMLADIGQWPFAVVALGLIAYGVYELVNARYRRIRME